MSVYVFLGPTLPVAEAKALLDATFLPPVACGDVQQLLASKPRAIGIIDGVFEAKPAVFHKEILCALAGGVRVFGASSMGALRAAELHVFGMEGVGRVFEDFRSGVLEDDDEVALIHGSEAEGYVARSEAMVNVREGLVRAERASVITANTRDALTTIAKNTFYAERSWRGLIAEGRAAGLPVDGLAEYVARDRPDLKREDAVAALRRMKAALAEEHPGPPSFSFAETAQWHRLTSQVNHAMRYGHKASSDIPARAFTLHAQLHADPERILMREALFLSLVEEVAEIRGIAATANEIAAKLRSRRLPSDDPAAMPLARLEVLVRKLIANSASDKLGSYVPLILLRQGKLRKVVDRVQRKWAWLLARGLGSASLEETGVEGDSLWRWYKKTSGAREKSIEALAHSLGQGAGELHEELLREYLFASRRTSTPTKKRAPKRRS